jgi:hypothetical protein
MSGAPSTTRPPTGGPGAPTSEQLPDLACIGFAVWTLYMTVRTRQLGADEVKRRKRLVKYSAAPSLNPERLEVFREGLRDYEVGAILIRPVPGDGPLRALLRDEGFELTQKGGLLDLWRLRAKPAAALPGRPDAAIDASDPTS